MAIRIKNKLIDPMYVTIIVTASQRQPARSIIMAIRIKNKLIDPMYYVTIIVTASQRQPARGALTISRDYGRQPLEKMLKSTRQNCFSLVLSYEMKSTICPLSSLRLHSTTVPHSTFYYSSTEFSVARLRLRADDHERAANCFSYGTGTMVLRTLVPAAL
jgi:hypothetical protein